MFAPNLGFEGQSIAVVQIRAGERGHGFVEMMRRWNSKIIELSAEAHDRSMAMLQAATHTALLAFGISLQKSGYRVTELLPFAPPPHRTMLGMLARIVEAPPSVYRDIQIANSFSAGARRQMAAALDEFENCLSPDAPHRFEQLFEQLSELLGNDRESLRQQCQDQFESLEGQDHNATHLS